MSHTKDKINFWKAENRQAIDSYDDSECNSRMLEGSYRFSLDPGKHTQCTKYRNLFQYEHFHEHLKWTAVRGIV